MVSMVISCLLSIASPAVDTLAIAPAVVSAVKIDTRLEAIPSPVSFLSQAELDHRGIARQGDLSGIIPGLHIPDYGASLTSTIYLRGFGSRMENPVLGLYIDDIPIIDKNAYDFDWSGVRRACLLRGPQGMLFGRNSMAGVLSLKTLSATDIDGTRIRLEYGSVNELRAETIISLGRHLFSANYRRSDGYFFNEEQGQNCDPYQGGGFRWKVNGVLSDRWSWVNTLQISLSDEGGFAYGQYKDGVLLPVRYNDESSYRRLSAIEGFKLHYVGEKIVMDAVSSIQILSDRLCMDQDFTPEPVFTLEQSQRSGAGTIEFILRPVRQFSHWQPQTGVFAFIKGNRMSAPVQFKEAGIRTLILDNANRNMPEGFGHLDITDTAFPVFSDFDILAWNMALYHESIIAMGRWQVTAGVRIDWERGVMDYDCQSTIQYQFIPTMTAAKAFQSTYRGNIGHSSLQVLPKVSALYEMPVIEGFGGFYLTVAKGFRAGGFNTQIFSDILRSRMMEGLMADLGVYLDKPRLSVGAEHTVYDPEEAWCYEAGFRYRGAGPFRLEAAAYYMDGRNQQLTVFPPGQSTGRMMTNAGRTRSVGIEAEAHWQRDPVGLHLTWSWNRAYFVQYNDGSADYAGKRVPYTPEHTLFAGLDCRKGGFRLDLDVRGAGPFWWNEANTLSEPFYISFNGKVSYTFGRYTWWLRGENLSGTQHRVFYFKSVGNEFFAMSKPRRVYAGLSINL